MVLSDHSLGASTFPINHNSTKMYASFNEAYIDTLRSVVKYGDVVSPRSNETRELMGYGFLLANPFNRFVDIPPRKPSYRLASAEMVWHWRKSNVLKDLTFYAPHMSRFSDDGLTINSAYGRRMWGKYGRYINQWNNCKYKLLSDKDTRQAYIVIADDSDIDQAVSPPCTNLFQFLIRNNKLNMFTYMRSNDAFRGLLYDVFHFTVFQEQMLLELQKGYPELEMGRYVHRAGSMHVYEDTLNHVNECIEYCEDNPDKLGNIPNNALRLDLGEKAKLIKNEEFIRSGKEPIPLTMFGANSLCGFMAHKLNTMVT